MTDEGSVPYGLSPGHGNTAYCIRPYNKGPKSILGVELDKYLNFCQGTVKFGLELCLTER